ncbi:MAG TPA: ATP-dependent Clp protease proteolytic subunit, partial [Chitinispirillaceae bacterium]|nr:ATP-dependent Clp protease proteolytic subunit [Chitinispirillaceae bacterium]
MLRIFTLVVTIIFLINSYVFSEKNDEKSENPVLIVIPVEGTVNASMAAFISRAIHESEKYPERILIFEIDTYGGEVNSAFQIVDTIVSINVPTIAYVKTKAISAGALIALSCNELVMKKSTTIGDVAPLTYSNDGPEMLGEKFQSPIRAKFRTLAKRNGYPELLTEAMVSSEISVYEVKFSDTTVYLDSTQLSELSTEKKKQIISSKNVVRKGELLTMDDIEANQFGFSGMSVNDMEEMITKMGYKNSEVIKIESNWSEKFAGLIGSIAPVLIAIGLASLYIELRSPGFGVPGIIGIICLGLVFSAQYVVGLAAHTEILLLGLGIVLLGIELLVLPGFGVAGFAGISLIIAGIVLSFQDFVIPKPEFPWQKQEMIENLTMVTGSLAGSIILIMLFFRFVFPRLGAVINGPYL